MKPGQLGDLIRQVITEVKAEKAKKPATKPTAKKGEVKPKASGKLVDLKKKLGALKQMRETIGETQLSEGGEETTTTPSEFSELTKYSTQLDKINKAKNELGAKLDGEIEALSTKIQGEVNKIKEMIGLSPKEDQEEIVDEAEEFESLEETKKKK